MQLSIWPYLGEKYQKTVMENYFRFYEFWDKPGAGQKTPEIFVLDHPTKSDVTSGLNGAAQLVSQSEKMAFRLGKIFFYLQTIRSVSFHTEDRNMVQAHFFDFWSKTVGKRERFSIVLKENNGEPSVIEWRILHICKTGVVATFGSYCSWFGDNTKCNSL